MREFELPLGRRWVRSVDADNDDTLGVLAVEASDELADILFDDDLRYFLEPRYDLDTTSEVFWAAARSVLERPYYQNATSTDAARIQRALLGDARWIYALERLDDGFWGQDVPTQTAAVDALSRFVLSGAIGDTILEKAPKLETYAEKYGHGRLQRAVIVGEAAVFFYRSMNDQSFLQGSYASADPLGQWQFETEVGADMHGDFRSVRLARPLHAIHDSIHPGLQHFFMPAVYESRVGVYHSTEGGIIGALLTHLVLSAGRGREELHASLYKELLGKKVSYGGNFGDYGDDDGRLEAELLRIQLEEGKEGGAPLYLFKSGYGPDSNYTFRIDSRQEGVAMCQVSKGEVIEELIIPNAEIEKYITTMVINGGGRVSPHSMKTIIDGLVTKREYGVTDEP